MTAEITREERALIDAAIAEGRVRKIETGASAYPPLKWCEKRNGIYAYMIGKSPKLKPGYTTPAHVKEAMAIAEKRREVVAQMANDGMRPMEVSRKLGIPISTIETDFKKLRKLGRVGHFIRARSEVDQLCRAAWRPGMGPTELAREAGVVHSVAANWIKRQKA